MSRLALIALSLAGVMAATAAAADTTVRGHTRRDGTYVQPHHRTNPDSSLFNNYGTQGNTNPYTGRAGTVDPYKPSSPNGLSPNYGVPPYGTQRKW